jgi:hypothetical protein
MSGGKDCKRCEQAPARHAAQRDPLLVPSRAPSRWKRFAVRLLACVHSHVSTAMGGRCSIRRVQQSLCSRSSVSSGGALPRFQRATLESAASRTHLENRDAPAIGTGNPDWRVGNFCYSRACCR